MSELMSETATAFMPSIMLLLFFMVFLGVAFWAFHPSRKTQMEDYGRIPLKDDNDE